MSKLKLTTGEVIKIGYENLKACYKNILIIIAIIMVPLSIITGIIGGRQLSDLVDNVRSLENGIMPMVSAGESVLSSFLAIIIGVITFFAGLIVVATIVKLLQDTKGLKELTWKEALIYVWERINKVILLGLLIFVIEVITVIILGLIYLLIGMVTCGVGLLILLPVVLLVAIIIEPLVMLYTSTLIIEDLGVMEAFHETNKLFRKGNRKNIFIKLLSTGACYFGISLVAGIFTFIPIIGVVIVTFVSYIGRAFLISCNNIIVNDELIYVIEDNLGE